MISLGHIMKNLYLLLLTISMSYNVFALEKPEKILGKQKQTTPNYLPYTATVKDESIENKKMINQDTGMKDKKAKEVIGQSKNIEVVNQGEDIRNKENANKNIWNENNGVKDDKKVEGIENKDVKDDKKAEGIENKDAKDDKKAEDIENKDAKDDKKAEDIENKDAKDDKKVEGIENKDAKDDKKAEGIENKDAKDDKGLEDKKNQNTKNDKKAEDKKVDQDINKTDDIFSELKASDEKRDKTTTNGVNKKIIPYGQAKQTAQQDRQARQTTQQESMANTKRNTGKSKVNDNKLKRWTGLKKEPVKEWPYQETQDKSIHMKQYNDLNSHLPITVYAHDYNNQLFYCVRKNDILCLRGIINKLENIGFSIKEILDLRNNMGDTSLIYAARKGGLDAVRFLLLQGADVNAVNNKFESALDVAYRQDIVNAVSEMKSGSTAVKKISNQQGSDMYNWAMNTKENHEKNCNKK